MPWNSIAAERLVQLTSGDDLTHNEVFLPTWRKIIAHTSQSSGEVADVGSGVGVLARELAAKAKKVDCFEPSEKAAEISRAFLAPFANVKVLTNSAEKGLPESAYSLVVAHMVVHVVADLDLFLRAVRTSLTVEGVFWFSVPHPCFYHEYKPAHVNRQDYGAGKTIPLPFMTTLKKYPDVPPVQFVHRSLAEYVSHLGSNGLAVFAMEEPLPPVVGSRFPEPWTLPRYLFVGALSIAGERRAAVSTTPD